MMVFEKIREYSSRDVAAAIGMSEGAVTGWASVHGIPQSGWTLPDIIRFLCAPRRPKHGHKKIDPDAVREIRSALEAVGFKDKTEDGRKCE